MSSQRLSVDDLEDEIARLESELDAAIKVGAQAEARIAAALALADTGSPEFKAEWPHNPSFGGVPGWRVVERMVEALKGA